MKSLRRKIEFVVTGATVALVALPAAAQTDLGLGYVADTGLTSLDIRTVAADIIRTGLGLFGVYLVILIMKGGFLMMTHGGNEDRRAEATSLIKNSIFGFILIMMSSSIAKFVIDAVVNATNGTF
jgi:hypothetical protein